MRSVLSRLRLCSQAAMVPAREAFAGMDLADQKDLVATTFDGSRHDLLGAAFGIHLSGVDQRHAEIEPSFSALTRHRRCGGSRPCSRCPGRAAARLRRRAA